MYNNLSKQKVLDTLAKYIQDNPGANVDDPIPASIIENLPNQEKISRAIVVLNTGNFIDVIREANGEKYIVFKETGISAFSGSLFKHQNTQIFLSGMKDIIITATSVVVTIAAVIALGKDNKNFATTDDIKTLQTQQAKEQDQTNQRLLKLQKGNDLKSHPKDSSEMPHK